MKESLHVRLHKLCVSSWSQIAVSLTRVSTASSVAGSGGETRAAAERGVMPRLHMAFRRRAAGGTRDDATSADLEAVGGMTVAGYVAVRCYL